MTTITVTNLNDSGAGSLRQAIVAAEAQTSADTIVFADTLAGGTITLQSALSFSQDELLIEGDIDSDGDFDITISGGGTSQLVNNYGSADTTINGVYFDQGYDNDYVANVIINTTDATLTISNSYIVNSDVTNKSSFGGTIVNLGDLTLTNVLIDQASAVGENSSPTTIGIFNIYSGTLTVDRVGVSGGGADSFLGVINYGDVSGGALGIGQGETGDDGTGLKNILAGNGSLTIGVTGDRAANTIDVSGASGDQAVLGFAGDDTITGSNYSDLLFGGAGDDQFLATGGSHKIYGDGGADEIVINGDSAGYSFIDTGDGLRILGYAQDHRVYSVETITFNDTTISAAAARAQSDELSTVVTNLNDSGDGSLRRAIFEASVLGGTRAITFSEDLAGGTIHLSSVLDIDASTAVRLEGDLDGDGLADITISGDRDNDGNQALDTRHFDVANGGYLRLRDINLTEGVNSAIFAPGGPQTRASSIDNDGTVRLENVAISGGTADGRGGTSAYNAAVIYNRSGANLELADVVLYDNTSFGGAVVLGDVDGGGATVGIFNDGGTVSARRFGVADSTATGGDGSIGVATKGGDGGDANSILLNTGGSVSIYASGVAGNTLTAGAGGRGGVSPGLTPTILDDGDDGNAVDDAAYVGSPNPFVSPLAGVTGTNVDDTFTDSASKGIVLGFGGDDVFNGDQSLSLIYGGTGDDTLVVSGDRFVAEFRGGLGFDTVDLRGATVSAGPGYNFELTPYVGNPGFLRFSDGVSARAFTGIERIFGSDGADRLVAGDTAITIHGEAGDDMLIGGSEDDLLEGGADNDELTAGGGNDTLDGGEGTDIAIIEAALDAFVVDEITDGFRFTRTGEDIVATGIEAFIFNGVATTVEEVQAAVEADPAEPSNPTDPIPPTTPSQPTGPTNGADNLIGTQGADTIRALGGDDTVTGLGGDDLLFGGGGGDIIKGSGGDDRLRGNGGDDRLRGNGGEDNIKGGGGADNIKAGGGADVVKGGGGSDLINGGGGADLLLGGGGSDTLTGRGGDDTLRGNGGADTFQLRASDRNETIQDFRQGQDLIKIVSGANSFAALDIEQDGRDVLIGFGSGQVRVVTDSVSAFSEDDFIF